MAIVVEGYWFYPTMPAREIAIGPLESSSAQSHVSTYIQELPQVFGNHRITLHGLRSGCVISLAISEVDLQTIIDHASWETPSTPCHYLRMERA